jgi:hypothetical protein
VNEVAAEARANRAKNNQKAILTRLSDLEQKVVTAPKKKRAGTTKIISISLDRELTDEAKRVARSLGMTLSGLIRQLLRAQIMTDADLTICRKRKENDSLRSQ